MKKEFNLQFFGKVDEKQAVLDEISSDLKKAVKFFEQKKKFDEMLGTGKYSIITPIRTGAHSEDRFYHVYFGHEDDALEPGFCNIVGRTLRNPKGIYRTTDANGFFAKSYIRMFEQGRLVVIVRDGEFTTAYPLTKKRYETLIRKGTKLYESKEDFKD